MAQIGDTTATPSVDRTSDRTSEAAHAAELLFRFMKRSRRLVDDAMAGSELNMPRAKILGALAAGDCPQGALAGTFDLAPRTITELVDGLEKLGYVERHVDPADRRVRRVHITDAGRQAHEHAWGIRNEIIERIFVGLDTDELTTLVSTLSHLDAELTRMAGEEPPPPCS